MTSVATGMGVLCAVGLNMATLFFQQSPSTPNPMLHQQISAKPAEVDVNLTGCLIQGSTAAVFVLQNAQREPSSATGKADKGARYVVVPATEDLFLKEHLNHYVRILGTPDGRPQPTPVAGRPVDENAVPRLNARALAMVNATCATESRGSNVVAAGGGFFGGGSMMASIFGHADGYPDSGTLLLIATGLLLVVYAGRRHEWNGFRRRPAR